MYSRNLAAISGTKGLREYIVYHYGGTTMEIYNKNRDNNHSLHDEIREQNAKLKDAPFREKLDYFKEYYLKMTIGILACVILIGSILYTMLTSPSDTAFAAFFFNDTGDFSSTALIDGFVEHMGIDTKEYNAYIDTSLNYTSENADMDIYAGLEKTMAVIMAKELDVIVGDTDTIDYFSKGSCFHDVSTILPEDLLEQYKDKLYYAKVEDSDTVIPVGIFVTDSPKLNEQYYYINKEPVLGFIINSDNVDTAIQFLKYLYMED